jgi:predicted amidohydrolase YtcJ
MLGIRPGDTRLETAGSVADVQAIIILREDGPRWRIYHGDGRLELRSVRRGRMPTLAELDAADADHPVVLYHSFTGPIAVNTKAKAFFAGKNIAVSDAGAIAINAPSLAALNAMRAAQTFADQQRGRWMRRLLGQRRRDDERGHGAFIPPGLPDMQDSFAADTLATG